MLYQTNLKGVEGQINETDLIKGNHLVEFLHNAENFNGGYKDPCQRRHQVERGVVVDRAVRVEVTYGLEHSC